MTVSGKDRVPGEGTKSGGVTIHELYPGALRTTRTHWRRLLPLAHMFSPLDWTVGSNGGWKLVGQCRHHETTTVRVYQLVQQGRLGYLGGAVRHFGRPDYVSSAEGLLGRARNRLRAGEVTASMLSRISMPVHVVRAMFITAWLFASEELHDAAFWNSFAVLTSLGHEGLLRPALVKPALSGMYLCYICEQYSRHQLQCRACGSDTPMCPECFMELHGQCRQRDQEWLFPSARNGAWTAVVTDGENRVVPVSCPLFVSLLVCKVAITRFCSKYASF